MSHYTLSWHDNQETEQHICEYANDAFEAVKNAREDVPYLHEHPFSCMKFSRRINEKSLNLSIYYKLGGYLQL